MSSAESMAGLAGNDPSFDTGFGGQLIVKTFGDGGSPIVLKGKRAVNSLWQLVADEIRGDRAEKLPGLSMLVGMHGLSIFDAEIPLFSYDDPSVEFTLPIIDACFATECVRCFEWLVKHLEDAGLKDERLRLAEIVRDLGDEADLLEEGSPRQEMAKIAVQAAIDLFDEIFDEIGSDQVEEIPGFGCSELFKSVLREHRSKKTSAQTQEKQK